MEDRTAVSVREGLLLQWINGLSINQEDEKLFEGMEWLKQGNLQGLKEEFGRLLTQYQKEWEGLKEKMRSESLETLRRLGIEGSAVEPNVEAGKGWEKESRALNQLFSLKLERIKERLRG